MVKCIRDESGIFKAGKIYETYMCGESHCIMKDEYIPGETRYLKLNTEMWDFEKVKI